MLSLGTETGIKKPGFITSIWYLGEERPGLQCKDTDIMEYSKSYFEKVFSTERMGRYFKIHKDEQRAILHYQSNIELAESFYPSLSIVEVALRNAISRELAIMAGREDWYAIFQTTPALNSLNRYITQATKQILSRHEVVTPSKIISELTLGFWVSLFNAEYELILWKSLRRAFPYLSKSDRKRKTVSAPLNSFRAFRNRVFHHESICWNMARITQIHNELYMVMGWINKDLPEWALSVDRVEETKHIIRQRFGWRY